jgi:hypothetical protein
VLEADEAADIQKVQMQRLLATADWDPDLVRDDLRLGHHPPSAQRGHRGPDRGLTCCR